MNAPSAARGGWDKVEFYTSYFLLAVLASVIATRLGFAGVTISDDLEANALKPYGSPGRLARLGVGAGIDLLLYARSYGATEEAARALEKLPRAELEAGAERVLALRASLQP